MTTTPRTSPRVAKDDSMGNKEKLINPNRSGTQTNDTKPLLRVEPKNHEKSESFRDGWSN